MRIASLLIVLFSALTGVSAQIPITERPLVYQQPGMDKVDIRKNVVYKTDNDTALVLEVYYPPSFDKKNKLPVVIFNNGVGSLDLLNWRAYTDWAKLIAVNGLIAINYQSRHGRAYQDTEDLIAYVRAHADDLKIDADRIGLWTCSANVTVGLPVMMQPDRTYIKCGVVYYGSAQLESMRTDLPILYVRSGLDGAIINTGIERTIRHMVEVECDLTYIQYAEGQHAFDILDDTDRSRQIIRQTIEFFTYNLTKPDAPVRILTAKRFQTFIEQGDTARAFTEYRNFVKYIRAAGTYSPFYTWAINENGLVGMGYQLLQNKKTKEALAVFSVNVESFPVSPNAYDCLSDAYEADGQVELAVVNAQRALDLLAAATNLNDNFKNGIRRSAEDKIKRLKK
ncbi:hypothetical protein JNL27_16550 [bacterium]|nr:hypothetical protein [bacterium]